MNAMMESAMTAHRKDVDIFFLGGDSPRLRKKHWKKKMWLYNFNKMGNPSNGPAVVKWLNIFAPTLKDYHLVTSGHRWSQ